LHLTLAPTGIDPSKCGLEFFPLGVSILREKNNMPEVNWGHWAQLLSSRVLSSRRNESKTPLGPSCGCETMIANRETSRTVVNTAENIEGASGWPCSIAFLSEFPAIQCEHGWVSGPQGGRVAVLRLSHKSNGPTCYQFFGTRLNSFALKHHPPLQIKSIHGPSEISQ